jgi:hypothetical protein
VSQEKHWSQRFYRPSYPLASQIHDLSRDLLSISGSLNRVTVDYIFYHHFCDKELQRELGRIRRRFSGWETPFHYLGLAETVEVLRLAADELAESTRMMWEKAKRIADEKAKELEAALHEAEQGADPEAWRRVGQALRRREKPRRSRLDKCLDELARQIPAERNSVYFALVFGTPVLPPGLDLWDADDEPLEFGLVAPPRIPAGVAWELRSDGTLLFTVFSSRVRSLKDTYQRVAEYHHQLASLGRRGPPTYTNGGSVAGAFCEGPGLPHIAVEVRLPEEGELPFPEPAIVDDVFRAYRRRSGRMLYDAGRKTRDTRYAIRAWTVALLSDHAEMSRREAIGHWNRKLAPRGLAYRYSGKGVTSAGEIQFQQDYRRLQARIERFRQEETQETRKT